MVSLKTSPHCIICSGIHQPHEMAMLRLSLHASLGADAMNGEDKEELPCEPVGDGAIAIGSVASCKEFWRSFVRSSTVMDWIEKGYRML